MEKSVNVAGEVKHLRYVADLINVLGSIFL